jgi:hypothetical protein
MIKVTAQLGFKGTVQVVLIGYSLAMPSSKSSSVKRKQQPTYDKNYHLKRIYRRDKDTRILISHCDLCNDELPKEADNIQYRINVLDEIDDSYESESDKHKPKLLLCSLCSREYNIPSYYDLISEVTVS